MKIDEPKTMEIKNSMVKKWNDTNPDQKIKPPMVGVLNLLVKWLIDYTNKVGNPLAHLSFADGRQFVKVPKAIEPHGLATHFGYADKSGARRVKEYIIPRLKMAGLIEIITKPPPTKGQHTDDYSLIIGINKEIIVMRE